MISWTKHSTSVQVLSAWCPQWRLSQGSRLQLSLLGPQQITFASISSKQIFQRKSNETNFLNATTTTELVSVYVRARFHTSVRARDRKGPAWVFHFATEPGKQCTQLFLVILIHDGLSILSLQHSHNYTQTNKCEIN